MNIELFGTRILCRKIEPERGPIALPDGVKLDSSNVMRAKVLAMGEGRIQPLMDADGTEKPPLIHRPCNGKIKVGDIIFCSAFAGATIKENGADLRIIDDSEVMGKDNGG